MKDISMYKHKNILNCVCGSKPTIAKHHELSDEDPYSVQYVCDYCYEISAYGDTEKEAISEWNRKCEQAVKL